MRCFLSVFVMCRPRFRQERNAFAQQVAEARVLIGGSHLLDAPADEEVVVELVHERRDQVANVADVALLNTLCIDVEVELVARVPIEPCEELRQVLDVELDVGPFDGRVVELEMLGDLLAARNRDPRSVAALDGCMNALHEVRIGVRG